MKRIALLLVLFGFMTTAGFAQNSKVDQRLYAKFSKAEVQDLAKKDPETLEFWTFYLDNGYSVQEMPKGKGADLPEVDMADDGFNVLSLGYDPQEVGNRYFRIKGSGKLLALHSYTEVKSKLKASK